MKNLLLFLFLALFLVNCSSDSTDDISETPKKETPTNNEDDGDNGDDGNDKVIKLTYTQDIAPTISSSCFNCHGNPVRNGANIPLTTEASLKQHGSDILSRISSGNMPRGGSKLSATYISNFEKWLNQK